MGIVVCTTRSTAEIFCSAHTSVRQERPECLIGARVMAYACFLPMGDRDAHTRSPGLLVSAL